MFYFCLIVYYLTNTVQRYSKSISLASLFGIFFEKKQYFLFSQRHARVLYIRWNPTTKHPGLVFRRVEKAAQKKIKNGVQKPFLHFKLYLCNRYFILTAMAQGVYNLGFISDSQIYEHIKDTVERYKTAIGLEEFNHNIIDPVKLTFDSKIYGKSFEEIIEAECISEIDKANKNHIGYFHQNLFRYAGNGWRVPDKGFDVVNDERKIYAEIKNKHNTMNSASGQSTYIKMQSQLLKDSESTCMLVEVISKQSQNSTWSFTLGGTRYNNKGIRRVSMDKFYEVVFGEPDAFMKLCRALPSILDDVIEETHKGIINNTVYSDLKGISSDTFKSLYLLAFNTYEGFDRF